jgi:F-type H+-transporting ATPase subunit a
MFFPTIAHAAEEGIHVSLSPYIVGHVFDIPITSTLITAWVGMAILITVAFFVGRRLTLVPGKVQSVFELMIGGVYDYMADVLESRDLARRYFPIVMTIFLFILVLNWFGLFPGVTSIGYYAGHGEDSHFIPFLYPSATDLNITLAFALIAFFTIQIAGVSAIGIFKYVGKFINFSSPLAFAIGLIELVSEIARLISFSFRLFGNILAGKTLLLVMIMLVPYVVPVPMMAFEVFVGFIQAFVFAILTLFFIKIAVEEPAH